MGIVLDERSSNLDEGGFERQSNPTRSLEPRSGRLKRLHSDKLTRNSGVQSPIGGRRESRYLIRCCEHRAPSLIWPSAGLCHVSLHRTPSSALVSACARLWSSLVLGCCVTQCSLLFATSVLPTPPSRSSSLPSHDRFPLRYPRPSPALRRDCALQVIFDGVCLYDSTNTLRSSSSLPRK